MWPFTKLNTKTKKNQPWPPKKVFCGSCRYYDAVEKECHNKAPFPASEVASWAKVEEYDWCGDWMEKEGLQRFIVGEANR